MRLQSLPSDPIICSEKFNDALKSINCMKSTDASKPFDFEHFEFKRRIKDSWIYDHFKTRKTKNFKIAVYVNAVLPINQNLKEDEIKTVGNHCVLVKGLTYWQNKKGQKIECLELETYDGCEETQFIPVNHPFFEEVQVEVQKIFHCYQGFDRYRPMLNDYGKKLAEIKWGTLDSNWFDVTRKLTPDNQKKIGFKNIRYKYEMLFIRATCFCFQLKFTS